MPVIKDRPMTRQEINTRYRRKRKARERLGLMELNTSNEIIVARYRIIKQVLKDATEINNDSDFSILKASEINKRSKQLSIIRDQISIIRSLGDVLEIVKQQEAESGVAVDNDENITMMEDAQREAEAALKLVPKLKDVNLS